MSEPLYTHPQGYLDLIRDKRSEVHAIEDEIAALERELVEVHGKKELIGRDFLVQEKLSRDGKPLTRTTRFRITFIRADVQEVGDVAIMYRARAVRSDGEFANNGRQDYLVQTSTGLLLHPDGANWKWADTEGGGS